MKTNDFITLFSQCGYGKKSQAEKWTEQNPKEAYDNDDLARCYEDVNSPLRGRWGDGGTSKRFAQSERMGNPNYLNGDVFGR